MQTTIGIEPGDYQRLLALAAERGEPEVSGVLHEAISRYVGYQDDQAARGREALQWEGALRGEDGTDLMRSLTTIREHWR